jgi:uncharacterized protein YfaT (DUF1175 family)
MLALLLTTQLAVISSALRIAVAETAITQARKPDAAWNPAQRDCAGLIRYSYRTAYRKLRPERLKQGLWSDGRGHALDFADAKTLVAHSFALLGRDARAAQTLQSGDILAFQQDIDERGEPVYHLMLVVRTQGSSGGKTLVIYHPGTPDASVRLGPLPDLAQAPVEWRPVPENSAFLGYFRFKEWLP